MIIVMRCLIKAFFINSIFLLIGLKIVRNFFITEIIYHYWLTWINLNCLNLCRKLDITSCWSMQVSWSTLCNLSRLYHCPTKSSIILSFLILFSRWLLSSLFCAIKLMSLDLLSHPIHFLQVFITIQCYISSLLKA